jgi:hypothetical protein
VLVSPAPRRDNSRPSTTHSQSDDDPETDDPETGDGGMDDPDRDAITTDEPSNRAKTSSSGPVTAVTPNLESDEPSGWVETQLAVLAEVVSGVASPCATSSAAFESNLTVLVGIVTPTVLANSGVDVPGDPASPAPVAGQRTDGPADQDPLPIADQLAESQPTWPVHHPPFGLAVTGSPYPLPSTGQLAELRPTWPVHHPLLAVIVLGAVTSSGEGPETVGTSRSRWNSMMDGIPQG